MQSHHYAGPADWQPAVRRGPVLVDNEELAVEAARTAIGLATALRDAMQRALGIATKYDGILNGTMVVNPADPYYAAAPVLYALGDRLFATGSVTTARTAGTVGTWLRAWNERVMQPGMVALGVSKDSGFPSIGQFQAAATAAARAVGHATEHARSTAARLVLAAHLATADLRDLIDRASGRDPHYANAAAAAAQIALDTINQARDLLNAPQPRIIDLSEIAWLDYVLDRVTALCDAASLAHARAVLFGETGESPSRDDDHPPQDVVADAMAIVSVAASVSGSVAGVVEAVRSASQAVDGAGIVNQEALRRLREFKRPAVFLGDIAHVVEASGSAIGALCDVLAQVSAALSGIGGAKATVKAIDYAMGDAWTSAREWVTTPRLWLAGERAALAVWAGFLETAEKDAVAASTRLTAAAAGFIEAKTGELVDAVDRASHGRLLARATAERDAVVAVLRQHRTDTSLSVPVVRLIAHAVEALVDTLAEAEAESKRDDEEREARLRSDEAEREAARLRAVEEARLEAEREAEATRDRPAWWGAAVAEHARLFGAPPTPHAHPVTDEDRAVLRAVAEMLAQGVVHPGPRDTRDVESAIALRCAGQDLGALELRRQAALDRLRDLEHAGLVDAAERFASLATEIVTSATSAATVLADTERIVAALVRAA